MSNNKSRRRSAFESSADAYRRMLNAYRICNVYSDKGVLRDDILNIHFETRFCRKTRELSFKWWTDGQPESGFVANSNNRRLYFSDGKSSEDVSLESCIASAGGASGGAAFYVCPLLVDLDHLSNLRCCEPYMFANSGDLENCSHFISNSPGADSIELWIEDNQSSLRKLVSNYHIKLGAAESEDLLQQFIKESPKMAARPVDKKYRTEVDWLEVACEGA